MKTHAKNAFTHKIEVFGKAVPTLLIGLLLVGTGTAATLEIYGTISGTAEVDQQAITLDSTSYPDTEVAWDWNDSGNYLGQTFIETHTLHNNIQADAEVEFQTECSNSNGRDGPRRTDNDIDWAAINNNQRCDGLETRFVEYYDEAGASLGNYEVPSSDETVTASEDIQEAVNNANPGDVILVEGDHTEDVVVNESVTLVTQDAKVTGGFDIEADNVNLTGFEITEGFESNANSGNFVGVRVSEAEGVRVSHNHIHEIEDLGGGQDKGVHVFNADKAEISDNVVENIESGLSAVGIMVQHDSEDAVVEHNTIRKIGEGSAIWSFGVDVATGSTGSGVTGTPSDTVIQYNHIKSVTGTGYPGAALGVEGSKTEVEAHYNNLLTAEDVENKEDEIVNATRNWFGTDGIVTDNQDSNGQVITDWETKQNPITVEAASDDKFGVINSFAINMIPDEYTLDTQIKPVTS